MVRRAKFTAQKAYPSDLVVLGFRSFGGDPEVQDAVQLGAVRLDRRTLEETASYSSLIRPTVPEAVDARSLRGTGINPAELADAPGPEEVLDGFEKAIFSGGEALSRARHRMIIVLQNSFSGFALLSGLLERCGRERTRYGERTLDLGSLSLQAQGVMGLKMPSGSLDLDTQLAAFGLPRPTMRDALEEARQEAEVLRRYQRMGVERERAYEIAALDPDLLALVRDVEGRPKIKSALQEFIQQRTGAGGAPPRNWRERLLRFAMRRRGARGAQASEAGPREPERMRGATRSRGGGRRAA
jgi:DNA polymerase III epsilon subunit-like protein